jgi:AhpD family alkylhydroperoxidase
MAEKMNDFQELHQKLNAKILESGNLEIKRFMALDKNAYKSGALTNQTKELLGLLASLGLRCQDCVTYHLQQCVSSGFSDGQLFEAFNVGLVAGGSVVIPHMRLVVAMLDEIRSQKEGL